MTAQQRLRNAIEVLPLRWSETAVAVQGGRHHRTMEEMHADGELTAVIFHPQVLAEVARAPTLQDVDAVRDLYIASLVKAGIAIEEARELEAAVAVLAADELNIGRHTLSARHAFQNFVYGTPVKDKVAAALALLVWSAWMYATPNLWSQWLDYGRKPVCDDYLKVYFVFKGFSPYDNGFKTFLIIFASGSIP